MPHFIMTGTNKTGRLDPEITDSDILGLGTRDLRTCVAVVIYGERTKRISLTHHIGGLGRNDSSILEEIEWVGSPFIIRLAKNTVGMREGLSEVSKELGIKTEADFAEHDTETRIIKFLRERGLIKGILKTRQDTSGQIFVTRDGQLSKKPSENADLRFRADVDLCNAIEMMNNIYSKVLLSPGLEFNGREFLPQRLVQPALYMLSLVALQLEFMHCENTLENVYEALKKIDVLLKTMGSKVGAKLEIYGESSARRDSLLDDIRRIISGKMEKVEFAKSIIDRMEKSVEGTLEKKLTI